MDMIQRTHFIGDISCYKIEVNTKYRQAQLIMPIKRAEDKTIDGYTIDATNRYTYIKVVFRIAKNVEPITYFNFTYVYSSHNWCIDCNVDFNEIIRIEVMSL